MYSPVVRRSALSPEGGVAVDIQTAEYAGTVATQTQAPPGDLPEVAFSGRSNVGKSSLINVLLRRSRKKIAHVSSTPGKTRALNFYRVNDQFFLVDLPGFGYARVPQPVQGEWRELIEGYLSSSPRLRGVVHLVDVRHPPTKLDRHMMEYLSGVGVPALVVATKMDKLKKSERARHLVRVQRELVVDVQQLLPFSSHTGEGRDELLIALDSLLEDEESEDA
ncbi:MAG TPA: YihA family ribosome biogenesis GTP-binding protein [Gemmatimonadetes bacterium]|nr:YihA family ribosome biogenesis GTP-binding protein [Gemmatimonadota bacterium]